MSDSVFVGALDYLIQEVNQIHGTSESDYIGADGILYCGVCHSPKQQRISFDLNGETMERTPPIPCKCVEERIARQEEHKKQIAKMEAIQKLRQASLMGEQFRSSTFDSYHVNQHNAKNYKLAQRYVQKWPDMLKNNQGMLLYGDTGTGKTFLAACIANALLEQQVPVMMTSFVKLISLSNTEDRQSIIKRLNQADLLIIDDLGTERSSDFALEQVYDYIDSRCQARKPMIITTNIPHAEIMNTTDIRYKRIYERVLKYCWPMEFSGPSWRRTEAYDRYKAMRALLEDE